MHELQLLHVVKYGLHDVAKREVFFFSPFFLQFSDVATLVIIHKRKFRQIWLQVREETRNFLEPI
jgi:hypothetical protein